MRPNSCIPSKNNPMINLNRIDSWSKKNTYKTTFEVFHGRRKPGNLPNYKGFIPNRNQVGQNFTRIAKNSNLLNRVNKNNNLNTNNLGFLLSRNVINQDKDLDARNHKFGGATITKNHKSWWPNQLEKTSTYRNFFLNPKNVIPNNYRKQEKVLVLNGRSGYGVNSIPGDGCGINQNINRNRFERPQSEYREKYMKIKRF